MKRDDLLKILNEWLKPEFIQDYCPNGLQIEGSPVVKKIATGVTASQAFIEAAIEAGADTLLVHHGYFWKGESPTIVGMKYRRIRKILEANLNLIAYHLPLDAHKEFGNNKALINRIQQSLVQQDPAYKKVSVQEVPSLQPDGILMKADLVQGIQAKDFSLALEQAVARSLIASVQHDTPIQSYAVCTGGGQSYIEAAVEAGVDAFITGEVSEQTIHIARENGLHFFAAGHHATERYGVYELGEKIAKATSLEVEFIDIDNPA